FKSSPGKPLNYKQVAGAMGVNDSQMRRLISEVLKEEVEKGKLVQSDRGKYKLKKRPKEFIEGRIEITKTGRGFVIVEGMEDDISVHRYDTKDAFWGDRVKIAYSPYGKRPKGKVIEVIERMRKQYVGTLEIDDVFGFVLPSDSRVHVDFFIPKDNLNGAKDGQKVIVELIDWPDPKESPVGKITEVLGDAGDNDAEMHAILAEYGLPNEFPDAVQEFANRIPQEMTEKEIKKRRDMRDILTFTIDPEDAKDFDDALSIQKLKNGNWEIGVHIADVSHYLKPGTILDQEAYERATSVYLVDRTIPMLPEILSNNLCSLRPNEDKYCFSAVFEMDKDAKVQKEWFGRTVIHSDRRFTYEDAQERIESGQGDLHSEINVLNRLARLLRSRRFNNGGIDFRTEEVRFKLDEKGKPVSVHIKVMKEANQLIEDFMLLANTRVARFIAEKQKTFVYRIHDKPDPMKLVLLREFVKKFGYSLPNPTAENADKILRGLMKQIAESPEHDVIQKMAIRSMAKAVYSTENIGHFGLAFDHYSHFTSPIRRYPDVMVHRLLQHYLDKGKSADASELETQCKYCSTREKMAQDAEWASIKYKQVEFMVSRLGEQFKGIVSGLSGWGIFVELVETKCEGMVSLNDIESDRFEFDEDRYIIYGGKTGKEFHMGDEIDVIVASADLMRRRLDFKLVE
ncbi:MAG: ribonuclease R, partial [Flavobacteriales bacterium]|nr:ribonuclease R [Flavobacteriales bacterium]